MKIIDIQANKPHEVSELIDTKCGYRWIAIYPTGTLLKEIECPHCGEIGCVIKTGQDLEIKE